MNIIEKINKNIIEKNSSKEYYYTKVNGYYVIHIINPNFEEVKLTKNNKKFYTNLIDMLFNKDKTGCFNYENNDDLMLNLSKKNSLKIL